jgi:hypothetical protein
MIKFLGSFVMKHSACDEAVERVCGYTGEQLFDRCCCCAMMQAHLRLAVTTELCVRKERDVKWSRSPLTRAGVLLGVSR